MEVQTTERRKVERHLLNEQRIMESDTIAWTCAFCTYCHEEPNELSLQRCSMCEAPRSAKVPRAAAQNSFAHSDEQDDEDEDEEEHGGFADCEDEVAAIRDGGGGAADGAPDPTSAVESAFDLAMEKDLAKAFANGGSAAATKVITKEYMRLMKLQTRGQNEGIVVSMPDEANGYRWAVAVTPPDDTALFNELQAFASKHSVPAHIEMEMLFSQDFPMTPPFVRVLRPRFAFHTGHVTLGGSICIELLTSSGWSPAYTIESLLIQLRSLFIVGEARLDPLQPNVAYGEQEAREAFRRVAAQHGWRV